MERHGGRAPSWLAEVVAGSIVRPILFAGLCTVWPTPRGTWRFQGGTFQRYANGAPPSEATKVNIGTVTFQDFTLISISAARSTFTFHNSKKVTFTIIDIHLLLLLPSCVYLSFCFVNSQAAANWCRSVHHQRSDWNCLASFPFVVFITLRLA
jgi:hypothetical protein